MTGARRRGPARGTRGPRLRWGGGAHGAGAGRGPATPDPRAHTAFNARSRPPQGEGTGEARGAKKERPPSRARPLRGWEIGAEFAFLDFKDFEVGKLPVDSGVSEGV